MTKEELRSLYAQVEQVAARDFPLGNLLAQLVTHLGDAHGLSSAADEAAPPETVTPPTKGESNGN